MVVPVSSDPAFKLIYGLDESLATAARVNAGSLGTAQNLSVVQSAGSDGIPSVSDGSFGKAVDVFLTRTGYTSAFRALRAAQATGAAHTAMPTYPTASALNDFAFGARVQYRAGNTGGGALETEIAFGLFSVAGANAGWGLGFVPDDATAPTAAKLKLYYMGGNVVVDVAAFTTTGTPPTYYLLANEWYRILVRVFFSGTGPKAKLYVYRESTGDLFTFTQSADMSAGSLAAFQAESDVAVHVSYLPISSTHSIYAGYVDLCWLYVSPLSDTDATSFVLGGLSIPWTPPSYRHAAHIPWVSVTAEGAAWPKATELPAGFLKGSYGAVDVACQRPRVRLEGWRAGRPWALKPLTLVFDVVGPHDSADGVKVAYDNVGVGLVRRPGRLPLGAAEFSQDMDPDEDGPRRRRGFEIRRQVSSESDQGANRFHFFRSYADQLYGLFKVGSKLYAELGASAAVLDTAWTVDQLPVVFTCGNRAIILSSSRRKLWDGSPTISAFGVSPPPTCTPSLAAGTLNGAYYWAVTEYDPSSGDESAPTFSALASPVAQGVTLALGTVSSETRFSKRRIYRTTNAGTAPNLFLVVEIATATSYTDAGLADGTTPIGRVVSLDADGAATLLGYLTGAAPDTFSMGCEHMERAFYGGGTTYPERIYPSESLGSQGPVRWYTGAYLTCSGPVRAIASWGHRLVAWTDNTVEIFESDWIRSNDGTYSVQHTVVGRRCGAAGPHAVITRDGQPPVWLDRRGIFTFGGDGAPECLSDAIEDLFPFVNQGISRKIVGSYNHVRKLLCFTVPLASTEFQIDNTRFQTWLVARAKAPTVWHTRDLEASFHGQFDDDGNGLRFGAIDHLGVFKVLEGYEGDGVQGNESYTTEDEGGDSGSVGISSIAGSIVTVFGAPGWTIDALRGVHVILRDRSTGLRYRHVISSNTSTTFTVVGTPNAALAARDGWYLGGINADHRFAENALGDPNDKIIREVHMEFPDLTGALYL